MKKISIRKIAVIALCCVFVASTSLLVKDLYDRWQADKINSESQEKYLLSAPSVSTPESGVSSSNTDPAPGGGNAAGTESTQRNVDFGALKADAPDALGWLWIPGTNVDYPLVHSGDNSEYLHLAYNRSPSISGAIFMDYRNSGDFSDFNTLIYGHNMINGTMFGVLSKYRDKAFWQEHPYVYVATEEETRRYRVFSAFTVTYADSIYLLDVKEEGRDAFLADAVSRSVQAAEVPPADQPVLTLSTCTNVRDSERFVVLAQLEP